jgi:carboxyl-terminal processing protease
MKRIIYTLLLLLCTQYIHAQPPSMQQKLYYTCKAWGFAKYYHSNVSVCNVNWDSVLLAVLPDVRSATTSTQFNDALMNMLNAAGPMAISTSYFPDTLSPFLKQNRDWAWMSTPLIRADVKTILDTIKNNFRPHPSCFVQENMTGDPNHGYLYFPSDFLIFPSFISTTFPSQDQRLLMLFKYWNVIRYFNPYNYVSDLNWDTVLSQYSVPIANAPDGESLYYLFERITAHIDDAHVDGNTSSSAYYHPPGIYTPKLRLRYFDNKYVVVKSGISGISIGDAIISIDGKTPEMWEDSLKQYYSCGNISVLRRSMYEYMLRRLSNGTIINLVLEDSTGTLNTVSTTCAWPSDATFFFSEYHYSDSLADVQWKTLNCDIGYVNMKNLTAAEVDNMYLSLRNKSAIIFDLRYGGNGTAQPIANLMYPTSISFAKTISPDTQYPGTFYWDTQTFGFASNPNAYTGKVIILFNEKTQSHGEWSTMVLEAMPNSIKIGTQTAGADGNVSRFKIAKDLSTGFTSLGMYYPNGDSTQRIGIVPDTVVTQTRQRLRKNRDNVLEKALTIAGCDAFLSTPTITSHTSTIVPYPNPCTHTLHLYLSGISAQPLIITITDLTGRHVYTHNIPASPTIIHTDTHMLSPGMYFVSITGSDIHLVSKFVKE